MKSSTLNSSKVQAAPIIRKVGIENETGNYKPICSGQNQSDQILEVPMLQPRFENFPKELQRHDRLSGKARRYRMTLPVRTAKQMSTIPIRGFHLTKQMPQIAKADG